MRRAKTAEQLTEALKTNKAANEVRDVSRSFLSLWLGSLDGYFAAIEAARTLKRGEKREAVAKARGDLLTSFHTTLDASYRQAYAKGRDFWGARPSNALSDRAAMALATQKEFATRFAGDVFSGHVFKPGNMSPAQRTAMFSRGLEGAFQRAVVDATPPGFTIWWRLGSARHCVDCPLLAANSPYTQETLPTMPRAGSCQCRTNCKCFLEFKTATGVYARDKPLTAIQRERGRGVRQRVEGPKPKPPRGLRLATDKERIVLADLEARQAFAVRRIDRARARGDDAEVDRWIGHRRDVSGQIREFADSRKIWHVPTFSTSEVVRGDDLRAHDVNWMTHIRGLDGFTVHRAQEAAIEQATKAAKKNLDKLLDSLPPSGGTVVPDFDELVRLAGGDTGSFAAKFGDAAITEAEVEPLALDPGQHIVFSLVGLGGAATLRVFEKAIALLRKTERAIWIGPLGGDDWLEVALGYGFVIEGPAKVVQDFIAELSRAVGGRGVEAAPWQA